MTADVGLIRDGQEAEHRELEEVEEFKYSGVQLDNRLNQRLNSENVFKKEQAAFPIYLLKASFGLWLETSRITSKTFLMLMKRY